MKKQTSSNNRLKIKQPFSFTAPDASSVQLVGDFTRWDQKPINLQKGVDGIWRTSLELAPGEHHYRFLVDGQWRDDPECALHVLNPYGSQNAVRHGRLTAAECRDMGGMIKDRIKLGLSAEFVGERSAN
jgi:1,4-alpha-glucan branching enzyme